MDLLNNKVEFKEMDLTNYEVPDGEPEDDPDNL